VARALIGDTQGCPPFLEGLGTSMLGGPLQDKTQNGSV